MLMRSNVVRDEGLDRHALAVKSDIPGAAKHQGYLQVTVKLNIASLPTAPTVGTDERGKATPRVGTILTGRPHTTR